MMVCCLIRDGQVSAAEAHPEGATPGNHLCHRINRPCSIRAGGHHPQRLCRSGPLHHIPPSTGLIAPVRTGVPNPSALWKLEVQLLHELRCLAGIGRAGDLDSMVKMASRPDAAQRWRRATTVIIDEVNICMPDQERQC